MTDQIFFWLGWIFISSWAIKTFYFSYQKKNLERLRITALGIELSALILFFLPWLPPSMGGRSGWQLFLEGNTGVSIFFLLLFITIILFWTKNQILLELASGLHLVNSLLLFVIMILLMPGTFTLTIRDTAPIITALMLLTGDVVVLLLWQQLQLKERPHKRK